MYKEESYRRLSAASATAQQQEMPHSTRIRHLGVPQTLEPWLDHCCDGMSHCCSHPHHTSGCPHWTTRPISRRLPLTINLVGARRTVCPRRQFTSTLTTRCLKQWRMCAVRLTSGGDWFTTVILLHTRGLLPRVQIQMDSSDAVVWKTLTFSFRVLLTNDS